MKRYILISIIYMIIAQSSIYAKNEFQILKPSEAWMYFLAHSPKEQNDIIEDLLSDKCGDEINKAENEFARKRIRNKCISLIRSNLKEIKKVLYLFYYSTKMMNYTFY